jgi:hypothetical protein
VRYYAGNQPVAQAIVTLTGAVVLSDESDATGAWAVAHVPDGTWRIEPRRIGGRGAGVSALDASYVLQHVAGMRTLDADQRLACDVTGNGALSALDATRILQLTVGLESQLPAAQVCGSDWLFVPVAGGQAPLLSDGACQPGAITLAAVPDAIGGQDFRALLLGDCTGNWQPAGTAATRRRALPAVQVRSIGRGRDRVALVVRAAAPFEALEAVLTIDPPTARVIRIRPALAARAGQVALNQVAPGRWKVAFASAHPIGRVERTGFVLDLSVPADVRVQTATTE